MRMFYTVLSFMWFVLMVVCGCAAMKAKKKENLQEMTDYDMWMVLSAVFFQSTLIMSEIAK